MSKSIKLLSTSGITGLATMEDFTLSNTKRNENTFSNIEILLEVARRANWDALNGPLHLRSGRFNPANTYEHVAQQVAQSDARDKAARAG